MLDRRARVLQIGFQKVCMTFEDNNGRWEIANQEVAMDARQQGFDQAVIWMVSGVAVELLTQPIDLAAIVFNVVAFEVYRLIGKVGDVGMSNPLGSEWTVGCGKTRRSHGHLLWYSGPKPLLAVRIAIACATQ